MSEKKRGQKKPRGASAKQTKTTDLAKFKAKDLKALFAAAVAIRRPERFEIRHPKHRRRKAAIDYQGWEAFLPPEPEAPKGFHLLGGLPYRVVRKRLITTDLTLIPKNVFDVRPWIIEDWNIWDTIAPTVDPCTAVPSKAGRVEIPVSTRTRMGRVSGDCARVYVVTNQGIGQVVNVITESVDATFTVTPNPGPTPDHPGGITPLVHPFTLGGINHKYKRLYVPASFYTSGRVADYGGFYVAVVDVDPTSASYLDTIDWIDCGWIPEEVAFTPDHETGVIANYMQGTATVFRASDGAILADEIDGFPGAAAGGGGAFSRSVAVGDVPGQGNRAFLTLSTSTGYPGLAMFDLDSASFPRTQIALPGGALGVAMTPDHRRVLTINFNGKLHVVRVDQATPSIERTIDLPTADRSYWAGIAVRPSGNLAFLTTGNPDSDTTPDSMVQVNYMTGTVLEIPSGLAPGTWMIDIESLGPERKPHLFVTSSSGMLTIIPC